MADLPFDVTDPRLAAAAWTRIAEPGDPSAGVLCAHLGPAGALEWLSHLRRTGWSGGGLRPRGTDGAVVSDPAATGPPWELAVARWLPRLGTLDIRRELAVLHSLGGRLVVPGDDEWPAGVDDLAERAPAALWARGGGRLEALSRAVAVVGMRASTGSRSWPSTSPSVVSSWSPAGPTGSTPPPTAVP